jgi:hypothetical protein
MCDMFRVYVLKIDICEMVISGKLNACALLHKELHIKTDKYTVTVMPHPFVNLIWNDQLCLYLVLGSSFCNSVVFLGIF